MISQRQLFLQYLAQTSEKPIQLEIERSEGIYLYDINNKEYIDLISGISVSNLGHRHPEVIKAIQNQLEKYLHLMVYGEYIQSPQVNFAKLLADNLPDSLNNTFFVNSGSEAIEASIKLAKRYTGRSEVISCKNAYHGSTIGALSVMGNEDMKRPFRPLMPGVKHIEFNNIPDLSQITKKTACIIIETVQGEAGAIVPEDNYLMLVRQKCDSEGVLLILDEVQTGFGRIGSLFAFELYNIIPDILVLAKGIAGGMPLGALISSAKIMGAFKTNPKLGHITTFGGHPVSCAAGFASLNTILKEKLIEQVQAKFELFKHLLKHKLIKSVQGKGLLIAVELTDKKLLNKAVESLTYNGAIVDWFLFNDNSFRISPPLIITKDQIHKACRIILNTLDNLLT